MASLSLKNLSLVGSGSTSAVAITSYSTATKMAKGFAPKSAPVNIMVNGANTASTTASNTGYWEYTFTTAPSTAAVITASVVVTSTPFNVPAPPINLVNLVLTSINQAFTADAPAGTVIGTISGKTAGSTIHVEPADSFVVSTDGTTLLLGLTPPPAGDTTITLIETHPEATSKNTNIVVSKLARVREINVASGGRTAVVPQGVYDLASREEADTEFHPSLAPFNFVAVKNGFWDDPTTWATGTVPTAGSSVNIGVFTVTHRTADTTKIKNIHVGGQGTFIRAPGSLLWVTTLMAHGVYLEGDLVNPITTANPVRTVMHRASDDAPGATVKFGIVLMGPHRIHGERKAESRAAIGSLVAGATTIDIGDAVAANWKVGDDVCIVATTNAGTTTTDATYKGPTTFYGNSDTSSTPRQFTQTKGFHLSHDEVRQITAINGNVITLNAPLDYAHTMTTDTTGRGDVVIVPAYVLNFSRSITYSVDPSLDLTVLQNRPHFMQMHNDDGQIRWVDIQNFSRTSTDPSLVIADTGTAWSMPFRASNGGALIEDPNNVRGRYGIHAHSTGAVFGRNPIVWVGIVVRGQFPAAGLTPTQALNSAIPMPGWGFTVHNSRVHSERCISYNTRGSGWVTEIGNEIGQGIGNWSIWNRGDGFEINWGYRAEYAQNHNGHVGSGWDNQSRQWLQQHCRASSSHVGWTFMQQNERAGALVNTILRRVPDDKSLRYRDPLTQGGGMGTSDVYISGDVDTYGIEQNQANDFIDNLCLGCDDGLFFSHRQFLDRMDMTPMIVTGCHAIATKRPLNVVNYAFLYYFFDFLWIGPGGTGAAFLGPVTWTMHFENFKIKNYTGAFYDAGLVLNYNAFWVDGVFENVTNPFNTNTVNIGTTTPTDHPLYGVFGPWTGTAPNMKVRDWKVISTSSASDMAEAAQYPTAPRGAGGLVNGAAPDFSRAPYFEMAPNAQLTATPTGKNNISFKGYIVDKIHVRAWPDWQDCETFQGDGTTQAPAWPTNPAGSRSGGANSNNWAGSKYNQNMTGTQLVLRNGCFNDNGTWKSRLWFIDVCKGEKNPAKREFVFPVDITLSGFDAAFLTANTVDPMAVKPALPMLPEVARNTVYVKNTTKPLIVTSPTVNVPENQPLVHILKANSGQGYWTITGGADASLFEIVNLAGVQTLRWTGNTTRDFENPVDSGANNVYDVAVTFTTDFGIASDPQAIAVSLTNLFDDIMPTFTDNFARTPQPTNLEDTQYWERISGAIGGGKTAFASSADQLTSSGAGAALYISPNTGSVNHAVQAKSRHSYSTNEILANVTDANNYLALGTANGGLRLRKVVAGVSTTVKTWTYGQNGANDIRLEWDPTTNTASVKSNGTLIEAVVVASPPPSGTRVGVLMSAAYQEAFNDYVASGFVTSFTDDFTGTNGIRLFDRPGWATGATSSGATIAQAFTISDGALNYITNSVTCSAETPDVGTPNMALQLRILKAGPALSFRYTSNNNRMYVSKNANGTLNLAVVKNGTTTNITYPDPGTALVRFETSGTTLTVKYGGVVQTPTSGTPDLTSLPGGSRVLFRAAANTATVMGFVDDLKVERL